MNDHQASPPSAAPAPESAGPQPTNKRRGSGLRYVVAVLVVLAAAWIGWHFLASSGRPKNSADNADETVTVAAARVERGTLARTIRLSAEFNAYQEIDVHAKVAGFIKSIPVDIGDRVPAGGLIATLEVPELQEDLNKAQAAVDAASENVKQADANYQGVHMDFTRLQEVSDAHPKLVAAQELDTARAKDQSAAAALASAKRRVVEAQAEQKRQATMVEYSRITAPFEGVVTKRYADTGALIQAGTSSSTTGSAVVRFAQENVLRAMFPVPESAVAHIQNGAPVQITINGLGRTVQGSVNRFRRQLNPQTRTMETEVDVPNDDLSITPGMFGWAELTLEEHNDALSIPVQALSVGEHPSVYVVTKDNKIEQRPVKVGMETPDRAEIVEGLHPGELVFIGNRSQIHVGATVKPKILDNAQTTYAANNG
ncbi:MAG: efflux RND transporter periplasmic adaptor subunit [Rhodospirillales bacterium]|nr:efflux RND transporter periplasmic adaptor subunit [Acetobacter sp.]